MSEQKFYTVSSRSVDKTLQEITSRGEKVVSISAIGDGNVVIMAEVIPSKPRNLLLEELSKK